MTGSLLVGRSMSRVCPRRFGWLGAGAAFKLEKAELDGALFCLVCGCSVCFAFVRPSLRSRLPAPSQASGGWYQAWPGKDHGMWRAVCMTGTAILRVPGGVPSQAQAFRRFSSMTHKQVRSLPLTPPGLTFMTTLEHRPWRPRAPSLLNSPRRTT